MENYNKMERNAPACRHNCEWSPESEELNEFMSFIQSNEQ